MIPVKEKYNKSLDTLKSDLKIDNVMALPKLEKIVVSVGFGKQKDDKERKDIVMDRLTKITGSKPSLRPAKQSIAGFKLREGQIIGAQVTLRGNRMHEFLDKLINVAIPRERDFRGIKTDSIDEMGNLTIGFKEHTIFPETSDEDLRNVFGFAVTLVSSAKNKEEALALYNTLGIPFKK